MINTIALYAVSWAMSLRDSIIEAIKPEDGQDILEYAVIVGAIGIAAAVAFFALDWGGALDDLAYGIFDCVGLNEEECGVLD